MDNVNDETVGGQKKDRRIWTNEEMLALLDCLEEHVRRGNRNDNGQFKPGTAKDIEEALNEIFPNSGLKADPHIASAMKKLKTQHHLVSEMLNLSGFSWNEIAKCVECDSDNAWQAYIKREPRAKGFRNKKLPYLERLLGIFGNDRANGQNSVTFADSRAEVDREEQADQVEHHIEVESSSINQGQHSSECTPARKKAKIGKKLAAAISNLGDKLFDALDRSSARVDKLGEAIKAAIDNISNDKMYEDHRRVMDELSNMDLSRSERVRAATYIMATPQRIHIFWGFKGEERYAFVKDLLEENH